jgi:hypothetical protein
MMRIFSAIVCLTGLWAFSGSTCAQPNEPIKAKVAMPSEVPGLGETEEKAKEVALREAVKTVNESLKHDTVDEHYVRKHMLVDEGHAGEDLKIANLDDPFKSWIVTFRPNAWNEVIRKDRSALRESIAGAGIFGITILLLVGVGYVRLDEYTHHRYTAWLRAAGSGLLALILAVSYFFVQGW